MWARIPTAQKEPTRMLRKWRVSRRATHAHMSSTALTKDQIADEPELGRSGHPPCLDQIPAIILQRPSGQVRLDEQVPKEEEPSLYAGQD